MTIHRVLYISDKIGVSNSNYIFITLKTLEAIDKQKTFESIYYTDSFLCNLSFCNLSFWANILYLLLIFRILLHKNTHISLNTDIFQKIPTIVFHMSDMTLNIGHLIATFASNKGQFFSCRQLSYGSIHQMGKFL